MRVQYLFDIEMLPQEIVLGLAKAGVAYIEKKEKNGQVQYVYDVPSQEAEEEIIKLLFTTDGSVNWIELINKESFDAYFAARVVKANGLPESEQVRTLLLTRFRERKQGFLSINYEDLCRYAEPFAERYGMDKLQDITKRMKNGNVVGENEYSLTKEALSEGRISKEEAELILYAYPCIYKPKRDYKLANVSFAEELFGE